MSGGKFFVCRAVWDSEDFADEPFTQREAFLWMVSEASYRDRKVRSGKYIAETKRGQLYHSVRFMAERWQWSKSRVSRFLKVLENRDTLQLETGTGVLLITICNYERFQGNDGDCGTVAGQSAGQKRDSSGTEKNKGNNYNNIRGASGQAALTLHSQPESRTQSRVDHFENVWKTVRQPRKNRKKDAEKKWKTIAKTVPVETLVKGYEAYTRSRSSQDPQYDLHLTKWLENSMWEDTAPSPDDYAAKDALRQRALATLAKMNGL